MKNSSHDIIQEVDWLMGSCLIIRKEGFLGFDDKNFFMYFEDVDVCRRAKKIGKKVIYNPEAEVIHYHARESAKHPWYYLFLKIKLLKNILNLGLNILRNGVGKGNKLIIINI
jgi:GT2 family glycosyltransferase